MFHRVAVSAPNKSVCQVFTINRNLMCTYRTNPITILPETSRAFDYCSFVNVLSVAIVARTFYFSKISELAVSSSSEFPSGSRS